MRFMRSDCVTTCWSLTETVRSLFAMVVDMQNLHHSTDHTARLLRARNPPKM
jgi:hypothetical protein